jgi:hypothetical protein
MHNIVLVGTTTLLHSHAMMRVPFLFYSSYRPSVPFSG